MTGVVLPILLLAAFGVVAVVVSAAVGLALPGLERVIATQKPRQQARSWIGVAALPTILATATVLVTLLPAFGLGSDHCLAHDPHHPHLCPHHAGGMPAMLIVAIAGLVVLRQVQGLAAFTRSARVSRATARALHDGSEHRDDLRVVRSDDPQAFALGLLRSTVHVSSGLLELGDSVVRPVLAHERAHARARDMLWRSLHPVLAAGHLPLVASRIGRRLATAQEMAADAAAARHTGDPAGVPHALVTLARLRLEPTGGLSFVHGDIEARVRALIEPAPSERAGYGIGLIASVAAIAVAIGVLRQDVHHLLETVLGALS